MTSRNPHRYILRDGREIVQFGITNGPLDRAREHIGDGKQFTSMTLVGAAVARDSAVDWVRDRIETYQQNHGGKKPRYNEI